ncbi:hypothetical protein ASPZODRAFT_69923 [Penicilliopsis zonata CBS 506.65]|uniref:mRNA N(6)-methyladenine demethylase n=1 Tax=Penicilliopsis zonata CBS 506.65 TaxID=1073090 RepID=A0A1L9SE89_9EURO|nr:hypothetical protein ASPZODRAFT_69923 [Penicilliopsis zonata CBS 506.65]OJJ45433.1 hypothetical protein ASPZODRAFT_69923 [Penicilliopsis zonata CBS 506.65]
MAQIQGLNAHDRPPEVVRQRYKQYQKIPLAKIDGDAGIIDLCGLDPDKPADEVSITGWMSSTELRGAFDRFVKGEETLHDGGRLVENIPVFAHKRVSGLRMIPALFPPTVQTELLSRLLHRDLSNKDHLTNVHLHYDVTYPKQVSTTADAQGDAAASPCVQSPISNKVRSFFEDDLLRMINPKEPAVHKPITVQEMLNKKLRWMTLGGQYDWTSKVYPEGQPPLFPQDTAKLLRSVFPETDAQAAIVNVYSAGDTLSVHRDVSEECDVGLISVSFGCDCLFLISHDDGNGCEIIRLRSGDAVYMDGASRFAWHGVPKIIPSTCPSWLAHWPEDKDELSGKLQFEPWRGWMAEKRINLNVRQMTSEKIGLTGD